MTRKRPHKSRSSEPPEADDLKLINGIGAAVEIRLHRVGIFTFAQLATMSPADIAAAVADLANLSSERIAKQDWIGQARKLTAESILAEPEWIDQARKLVLQSTSTETKKDRDATTDAELQQDTSEQRPGERLVAHRSIELPKKASVAMEHPHKATFTVELLFDEENALNSTRIVHTQSGEEKNWIGWQESQLVGFLARHANLRLQPVEVAASMTAEAEPSAPVVGEVASFEPLTQEAESGLHIATEAKSFPSIAVEAEPPILEGREDESSATVSSRDCSARLLHMSKPQLVLSDTHIPENMLHSDQTYEVHFMLHLTDAVASPTSTFDYTASVYGRTMDRWTRLPMGVVQGTIRPMEEITVTIKGASLPQGIYWLEAETLVPLPLALERASPGRELVATVKGRLFEIY